MHTRLEQLVRHRAAHLGTHVALQVPRTLSGHHKQQRAPHVSHKVTPQLPNSRLRSVCRSQGETVCGQRVRHGGRRRVHSHRQQVTKQISHSTCHHGDRQVRQQMEGHRSRTLFGRRWRRRVHQEGDPVTKQVLRSRWLHRDGQQVPTVVLRLSCSLRRRRSGSAWHHL